MDLPLPQLRSIVLDTTDARSTAEFYKQLLGWSYLAGFEPPQPGTPDPLGADWLVLLTPDGGLRVAFQQVPELTRSTWPRDGVPQQLHLDFKVGSPEQLAGNHQRALELGATVLEDRSDDPEEPLYVYADPAGHPSACSSPPGPEAVPNVDRCNRSR